MRLPITIACVFALAGQAWFATANAASSAPRDPVGTCHLFKDSCGKVPKSGAVVELTLNSGNFSFKAVQPGETVTDRGKYKISGRTITFEFTELEKGRQSGPFSVSTDTLVLPFPMLSEGQGSSTWMTPAAIKALLSWAIVSRSRVLPSMPLVSSGWLGRVVMACRRRPHWHEPQRVRC